MIIFLEELSLTNLNQHSPNLDLVLSKKIKNESVQKN